MLPKSLLICQPFSTKVSKFPLSIVFQGIHWWSSGQDLALSLPQPGFYPQSGNQDLISHLVCTPYPRLFQKSQCRIPREIESRSVVSDSLRPHGLQPARLLCPWHSPGQNTGVSSRSLLQGIFSTQGSNPGILHCRQILNHLSHQGSPN